MLFDVNVSLLIDAESREDAMRKSSEFLAGNISPDLNYLVNDAEPDESFTSLEALRNKSNLTKRAADGAYFCPNCETTHTVNKCGECGFPLTPRR